MLSTQQWTLWLDRMTRWVRGAAALNHKIIEIAQQNVSSGFGEGLGHGHDAPRGFGVTGSLLAQAFSALAAQAEEVRALSTKMAAEMTDQIKTHMTRGLSELREEK